MDFMLLFLPFYLISSVCLTILFMIFRERIQEKLYFFLPFVLATVICFPAFLFILGYWSREWDVRRMNKKKNRVIEFEYQTRKYTPNYAKGKVGK